MMRYSTLLCLLIAGPALADDAAVIHCRQIADSGARLSCYDAIVAAPATSRAPAASVPADKTPEAFGLAKPTDNGVESVESSIEGDLNGWNKNDRIRLANGQVWLVTDDVPGVFRVTNPKVTIHRGLLGAYYLSIDGKNRSVRVKRLR
jgi:hypothetical protein